MRLINLSKKFLFTIAAYLIYTCSKIIQFNAKESILCQFGSITGQDAETFLFFALQGGEQGCWVRIAEMWWPDATG